MILDKKNESYLLHKDKVSLYKMCLFHALAKNGSIKKASDSLGILPITMLQALKVLSRNLGKKLYVTQLKKIVLTEDGKKFAIFCAEVLNLYKSKNFDELPDSNHFLSIASTYGICEIYLTHAISILQKDHPDVKFKVLTGNQYMNFISGGIDIVIGPKLENRSDLSQTFISKIEYHFYASPEYIKKYGNPKTFEDLKNHKLLVYHIEESQYIEGISNFKNIVCESNCYDTLISLALDGKGVIALTENHIIGHKIDTSQLQRVDFVDACDFDNLYFISQKNSSKHAIIATFEKIIFTLLGAKNNRSRIQI